LRTDDIEVCLKPPPGRDVDIVIAADLGSFTKMWLGYCGLIDALDSGQISLHGSKACVDDSASPARAPRRTKTQELQIFSLVILRRHCGAVVAWATP
jgi:hypothetical protein